MRREQERAPLTVVVIPLIGDAVLEGLLERLLSDGDLPSGSELLIVAGASPPALERLPNVRWIACDEGTPVPRRRALGAAAAEGSVIAFLEDTTWPDVGWGRSVVDLHRGHGDAYAIGGTLALGGALSPKEVALALLDYSAYLRKGPVSDASRGLPGNNFSFKREPLLESRPFAEGSIQEAELFAAWARVPNSIRLESAMQATLLHADPVGGSTEGRFQHARLYAGRRVPRERRVERVMRAVLSPALIPLFAARTGPKLRGLRRSPSVFAHVLWMSAAWSAGEAIGYLYGAGEAEKHWR